MPTSSVFRKPEIQLTPKLPKIPDEEPLPADLASLLQRAPNLSPQQYSSVENILRTHHDVFSKDKDNFGACP